MITHLLRASHPNPKRFLSLAGVMKGLFMGFWSTNCTIPSYKSCYAKSMRLVADLHCPHNELTWYSLFQAMVRVLKCQSNTYHSYLPPPVTIFIGDGFKFLVNNQATYDIIITIPLPSSYQNLCVFEEGKGIRPPFGQAAAALSSKQPVKEALFSSGLFTRHVENTLSLILLRSSPLVHTIFIILIIIIQ